MLEKYYYLGLKWLFKVPFTLHSLVNNLLRAKLFRYKQFWYTTIHLSEWLSKEQRVTQGLLKIKILHATQNDVETLKLMLWRLVTRYNNVVNVEFEIVNLHRKFKYFIIESQQKTICCWLNSNAHFESFA